MKIVGKVTGRDGARDSIIQQLCRRLGGRCELRGTPVTADTDIVISWRFRLTPDLVRAVGDKTVMVCIDLGYFDGSQFETFSISINGIHGLSMPVRTRVDDRPRPAIKPWQAGGEFVQIISPGWTRDGIRTAASDLPPRWLKDTVTQVIDVFGKPAKIRHHPRALPPGEPRPPLLDSTFEETYVSVTYGSTTAIQTICAGVPTIIQHPRSPAFCMGSPNMERVTPDGREAWLRDLSNRVYHMTNSRELDDAAEYILRGHAQATKHGPMHQPLSNYGIREEGK